jgi:hypothetical protein
MSFLFAQNSGFVNAVSWNFNGTIVNGIKIKTNLPFTSSHHMPTIKIEGYNYGAAKTIGLDIVYYPYDYGVANQTQFIAQSISSWGDYKPNVKLSEENGKVVIFIEDKPYFMRFNVSVYEKGLSATNEHLINWTVADEALAASNKTLLLEYKKEVSTVGGFVNAVSWNFNGTITNGIKIKTNLPFIGSHHMPTIKIEGYNYETGKTIGLNIVYYPYDYSNGSGIQFIRQSISSWGDYKPNVKLSEENGKVVIFIEDKPYFMRFNVSVYEKGLSATTEHLTNWTVADEALATSNKTILLEYKKEVTGGGFVNAADWNFNGTIANGIKIRTNLPFVASHHMPTIKIEGYNYGTGQTIGLNMVYYPYDYGDGKGIQFINKSISSWGDYKPNVKLSEENGKIVIFIEDKPYYMRFNVSIYDKGLSTTSEHLTNWTVADEVLATSNKTILLAYKSGFDKLGIATSDVPGDYKLAVNGNVIAEKIVVKFKTNWPDYVFKPEYKLPPLSIVEQHIKEKGHLQDIPSEKEVAEKGIDLGSMDAKLLQKVEELTLYLIQQQKLIEAQNQRIEKLETELKKDKH